VLSGTCPATLVGTDNPTISGEPFVGAQATQFNGTLTGSTCHGPVNGVGFVLDRQSM
jgi:hypothetical protein